MPSYYDLPAIFGSTDMEDADRFQKLPFFLAKNQVKLFPRWNIFDQLFGTIPWQPNMGNVMRGVTPQPSPVGQTFFFPSNITEAPKKNVYQVTESVQEARVKWHRYESKQFHFIPYFNAFWRDHISFANKDITRQIQVANNFFLRTVLWFKSPFVYVAGKGVINAPVGDGNAALDAAGSKTKAWTAAQIAEVNNNMSLRVVYRAGLSLREDLGAPPFEGVVNMPEDNEGIKGKYVLVGSTEAWDMFPFDPDTNLLKSINLDLLFKDFTGLLFGKTVYKFDPYPIRFKEDGTPVAPEVTESVTLPDGSISAKSLPNPEYVNPSVAPYEVAFMLGADALRSIKVGPPPKEFATKDMKASKFYSLRWNGEVIVTDQFLIDMGDGKYELNTYGTALKLISQLTHGALPGEPRYCIPILFRRKRAPEV